MDSDSTMVPPGIINASNSSCALFPLTNPFDLTKSVGRCPKFSYPGTAPLTYVRPIFILSLTIFFLDKLVYIYLIYKIYHIIFDFTKK